MRTSPADARLRDEIHAFVASHWPGFDRQVQTDISGVDNAYRDAWFKKLFLGQWALAAWPEASGGLGWSMARQAMWDNACAKVDAPRMAMRPGVSFVGPALLAWGSRGQMDRFLPPIRDDSCAWCVGIVEPHQVVGMDIRTIATELEDGVLVNGTKGWVRAAERANWMFTLARVRTSAAVKDHYVGLLVDLRADGITIEAPQRAGPGDRIANVRLDDANVPMSCVIDFGLQSDEPTDRLWARFLDHEHRIVCNTAGQHQRLNLLRERFENGIGEHLSEQLDAAEIQLQAIEAMEVAHHAGSADELSVESAVLRVKRAELVQDVAWLQVQSFAYYAVSDTNELLLDNEGPIGPEGAAGAINDALMASMWVTYLADHRDKLAKQLGIVDEHETTHIIAKTTADNRPE